MHPNREYVLFIDKAHIQQGIYRGPALGEYEGSIEVAPDLGDVLIEGNVVITGKLKGGAGTHLHVHGNLTVEETISLAGALRCQGDLLANEHVLVTDRLHAHDLYGRKGIESSQSITTTGLACSDTGTITAATFMRCERGIYAAGSIIAKYGDIESGKDIVSMTGCIHAGGNIIALHGDIKACKDICAKSSILVGFTVRANGTISAGLRILVGMALHVIPDSQQSFIEGSVIQAQEIVGEKVLLK